MVASLRGGFHVVVDIFHFIGDSFDWMEASLHQDRWAMLRFSGNTTPCKATPVILHGVVSPETAFCRLTAPPPPSCLSTARQGGCTLRGPLSEITILTYPRFTRNTGRYCRRQSTQGPPKRTCNSRTPTSTVRWRPLAYSCTRHTPSTP